MTIAPGAVFGEPERPQVKITALTKNGASIPLTGRVVIKAGQSISVSAQIELNGQVIPVSDTFAVPVSRVGGDIDQTIEAVFVDGLAQIDVDFPRSGEYAVLAEWLNLHLPPEQQMNFEPFYISVTK
jgi:hypothetical protein